MHHAGIGQQVASRAQVGTKLEKITKLTSEWDVAINNAAVNLWQYESVQKDNTKLAEEISKLKKLQGSGETAPIAQKLKQQVKEKDNTISEQQQEINDISTVHNKVDTELTTLRAEHEKLRQEHIAQKHKLNTAKDNVDALMDDNNKSTSNDRGTGDNCTI